MIRSGLSARVEGAADDGSEFVEYDFRCLSKTLIPGHWVDFRKGSVLKKARKLFETKVCTDHVLHSRSIIGQTLKARWSEDSNGGVDATFRIYQDYAGEIISRIDRKLLDAVSIGFSATYEKSHPELSDFYWKLGHEVDGKIVRFIVTEILTNPGNIDRA